MVLTPSTMLTLGTKAPDFSLPCVVTGQSVSLESFREKKILLVMFICRHCPYVQHVKEELGKLGEDYEEKDIGIVAISSNDAENYPDDSPESLKKFAEEVRLRYPILYDETQEVAKAYRAACTPDFYVFNEKRELVYRGQLDGSRPGNNQPVTGQDLRRALNISLNNETATIDQKPSIGCNIKWKKGHEPDYFGS